MFRKLVSNLPFSPSLINQLGFYSRRLKKERATRKIGLVFTVLAIVAQSFTIIAPAKPSLAQSPSDIVYGGAGKSASGIVNAYFNGDSLGRKDIRAIFNAYGITDANIRSYRMERIYSSVANNYWTTGRSPRGYGGETSYQIPGGPRIYLRTLAGWSVKWWDAMRYDTPQGPRWILLSCGNVVVKNPTGPNSPDVAVTKTVSATNLHKGQTFDYTVKISNLGAITATGVAGNDKAPAGIEFIQPTDAGTSVTPDEWKITQPFDLAPGASKTFTIKARVTTDGATSITNVACALGNNGDSNGSNNCGSVAIVTVPPCTIPGKEHLPKDSPECTTHPGLEIEKTADKKEYRINDTITYKLVAKNVGDVALSNVIVKDPAPSQLEFLSAKQPGDNEFVDVSNKSEFTSKAFNLAPGESLTIELKAKIVKLEPSKVLNQACVSSGTVQDCDDVPVDIKETCPTNPDLAKDDENCLAPCTVPGKEHLPYNSPECQPCDETRQSEDGKDISCLILKKNARNITQNIDNANGTTVGAGDTIEYTVSVTNKSKLTREGFVIEENISDILEYADVLDTSGAKQTGPPETPVAMLIWEPADIKPEETISRTFSVKVKSPIPVTPASTSDHSSYDMKMVNVYGNTVTINLPSHPVKTIEETIRVLPSTGLGTNVAISTALLMGASYFFFRSRLMVKELGLVRKEFNYGAGA